MLKVTVNLAGLKEGTGRFGAQCGNLDGLRNRLNNLIKDAVSSAGGRVKRR